MIKVAPGNITVAGLDVSHYDEVIDFQKVAASGRKFCFAKCTEYTSDKTYARNKAKAKDAGLLFGAYHFFHPTKDVEAQASNFLRYADLKPGELLPVLDWETSDGVPSAVDRARGRKWLDIIKRACGKDPIIYGSPYFLADLSLDESFTESPLWIANYNVAAPLVPLPWKMWSFWQHSERGAVPGIPAPDEDLDMFNGPLENLKKLTLS